MPNPTVPADFSPLEKELVQSTLLERYGRVVPLQPVEVELQIDPKSPEASTCAALYWQDGEAAFVLARMIAFAGAAPIYRAQFFYGEGEDAEVFGTGHANYGNLGDCLVSILQVQAEHEATRRPPPAPAARAAQPKITRDEDYDGPLVI